MANRPKKPARARGDEKGEAIPNGTHRKPRIVACRCPGLEDLAAVARLRGQFERDAKRWKAERRESGDLVAAIGYWMGYPSFLEMIGHEWQAHPVRLSAYHALNLVHERATHILMEEAEKLGLDCYALYEAAQVCRQLFAEDPGRYYIGQSDLWPECLGMNRYALPPSVQEAIRSGESTFIRLAVKAGLAQEGDPASVARAISPRLEAGLGVAEAEDGGPFYKPSHFKKYNIGDELLRRNATDGDEHVPGKVRRVNRQTVKGRKAVYWYSEPDARKCWPHKFADAGKPSS